MNKTRLNRTGQGFLVSIILAALVLSACVAKPDDVRTACTAQNKGAGEEVSIGGNSYVCPGAPAAAPQPANTEQARIEAQIKAACGTDGLVSSIKIGDITYSCAGYKGTLVPTAMPAATATPGTTDENTPVNFLRYDNGTPDCGSLSHTTEHFLPLGMKGSRQSNFVANILCVAIAKGTETSMFDAVAQIQNLADNMGAQTWEGTSVTIPIGLAAIVWCDDTHGLVSPNDVGLPLSLNTSTVLQWDSLNGDGNILVVHEIGGGVEDRTISNCANGRQKIWAVAAH